MKGYCPPRTQSPPLRFSSSPPKVVSLRLKTSLSRFRARPRSRTSLDTSVLATTSDGRGWQTSIKEERERSPPLSECEFRTHWGGKSFIKPLPCLILFLVHACCFPAVYPALVPPWVAKNALSSSFDRQTVRERLRERRTAP